MSKAYGVTERKLHGWTLAKVQHVGHLSSRPHRQLHVLTHNRPACVIIRNGFGLFGLDPVGPFYDLGLFLYRAFELYSVQ